MHVKNGRKDLKTNPQISRRVRDTLARLFSKYIFRTIKNTSSLFFLLIGTRYYNIIVEQNTADKPIVLRRIPPSTDTGGSVKDFPRPAVF